MQAYAGVDVILEDMPERGQYLNIPGQSGQAEICALVYSIINSWNRKILFMIIRSTIKNKIRSQMNGGVGR